MKLGLAAWHYPHRDIISNIAFFTDKGFDAISFNGGSILNTLREKGTAVAEALRRSGLSLTLHFTLPADRLPETVMQFKEDIRTFGQWQEAYGLVENLTFDVPGKIREDVTAFVQFVLDTVPGCRIGLEDFGLSAAELEQIKRFANNDRFGYLVDIGHLYIRLRGENESRATLFSHSDLEGEKTDAPDAAAFLRAFSSKTFPIIEMHLHNNDGIRDTHLFLEDGSADIRAIAKALCRLRYEGILTIESAPGYQFPCYGEQADEGILRTLHYLKKCLADAKE